MPTLKPEDVKAAIERGVPGVSLTIDGKNIVVAAKDLISVCQFLKTSPELQMDHVANHTAVDYPSEQRIDAIYHLGSMAKKQGPVGLRVPLPRANPTVPSLVPLYRGAEFQERETWDLFGVKHEGHPDLRRILLWKGFEGHPMRKDYVVEDQDAAERPA